MHGVFIHMLRMLETHCHNTTAREFLMHGGVLGLHIMIQFRTRVFPTVRRLARIQSMPERFRCHWHACYGGDVPESIGHIMFECPHWECHRRNYGP
jgi:hypothetical protein